MTNQILNEIEELFIRTEEACTKFMEILQPRIEGAKDDYQHLYWHHIYEEEEQRIDRLRDLLPRVHFFIQNHENQTIDNLEFIHLLQDISLEKFGLHNFEEHLDLVLFDSQGGEHEEALKVMRQMTEEDYEKIKALIFSLNQTFDGMVNRAGSTPTDEKDNVDDHLKLEKFATKTAANKSIGPKPATTITKRLTVGSLKF